MWREKRGEGPSFGAAQLRLRRALTDALNPWIDLDAIIDMADESPANVSNALVEAALSDVANAVERVREEAWKTHRDRKRELKRQLRG